MEKKKTLKDNIYLIYEDYLWFSESCIPSLIQVLIALNCPTGMLLYRPAGLGRRGPGHKTATHQGVCAE